MAFTPEDVADNDIPSTPYFTVSEYVKRVRALALALLLVGSAVVVVDPDFGLYTLNQVQAGAAVITGVLDTVTGAYLTGLAAGEQESGMTIHLMDEGVDTGPILVQKTCPVLPGDTPETLKARVQELEKEWYPKVLEMIHKDDITLSS
jgi:hypothetical protein